ncbi:cofactor-independent phosphoglycerate mutase [Clostridium sp. chh4-2]|uniref:cofactor-independent phosphoglycerate mutase n=1 Tax=Clostridium sp. chh4-2 TaxID=2067550 RepID=UPI000CCF1A53|nr:cofactor-independent phosphoglycerate mutase [Clostridium sp. chh4-2]PNV60862.1 cofactor-independent phosphoglycerate mutase [Clostridium sp. chh4-2]
MKYIVMLGDGMADYPVEKLGGCTPLQKAQKPNIDRLASKGVLGMVKTVPDGLKPGSDVANLSAMGYNPVECYTGRSPLEAVSIGIEMSDTDVAFRCNLVTLSDEADYDQKTMVDYSSDEISTAEAAELILAVNEAFKSASIEFYPGISYRHCMIWHEGPVGLDLTPPHDISDRKITEYVPKNEVVYDLMKRSHEVLKNHPVNQARIARGLHPANSIWLWGEGTKPGVSNFEKTYGVKGSVISAVDLIKGIGICAGMKVIEVEGATGNIDTNFSGKGKAALDTLLEGQDLVYIHVEAPDECGHRGEIENKVKAIELIDELIVGPLLKGLEEAGEEYSILVMPDHPTPLAIKTHISDPVPYLLYRSTDPVDSGISTYTEETCASTGRYVGHGYELMKELLEK